MDNSLIALELERQKALKALSRHKFTSAIIGIVAAVFIGALTQNLLIGAGAFLFCAFGFYYGTSSLYVDRFKQNFKYDVIRNIVESCGLKYSMGGYVGVGFFHMIFNYDVDKYGGGDLISGEIDGVKIQFSDIWAMQEQEYSHFKGDVSVFTGILLVADFPKRLKAITQIKYGGFDNMTNYGGKRAIMDDANFEEIFDVYTTDQIEARYALTPNFMQQFLRLRQRLARSINAVLLHDKICIAIRTGRDSFEPDLNRPLVGKGATSFYKAEIGNFLAIVEELRLNRKIWAD